MTTVATQPKAPAKPVAKPARKRAPAKEVAAKATKIEPDRTARVAQAAAERTNAMALVDALSQAGLSREALTRLVVARGGPAPGVIWRESVKGTVDAADREFIWATLAEHTAENAERAARVAEHVRETAVLYLERTSS